MKTSSRPFEGILGNTIELRILERLIASPDMEFNPTDLAKMTGVSRESATNAIKKLSHWNMMVLVKRRGNMDFYRLNAKDPMVKSISRFNDIIIVRMFPEVSETLDEIENESNIPVEMNDAGAMSDARIVISPELSRGTGKKRRK